MPRKNSNARSRGNSPKRLPLKVLLAKIQRKQGKVGKSFGKRVDTGVSVGK